MPNQTGKIDTQDNSKVQVGNNTFHTIINQYQRDEKWKKDPKKKTKAHNTKINQNGHILESQSSSPTKAKLTDCETACLRWMWFPNMNRHYRTIKAPISQTCDWVFKKAIYRNWFNNDDLDRHYGLLWIKGKPGTGKSTLMKEIFREATEKSTPPFCTAAFFFNAKGDELERSTFGLYRSLLYQLLPHYPALLDHLTSDLDEKYKESAQVESLKQNGFPWLEVELKNILSQTFASERAKRTIIFIDGLDECDRPRDQTYFWRELTKVNANNGCLSVCLSSRHVPAIGISYCPQIIVEKHNDQDISTYVDQKFKLSILATNPQWASALKAKILDKASGVFLWVILVVDKLLQKMDEGKGLGFLKQQLEIIPKQLEELFGEPVNSINPETRGVTVQVFQWAILAAQPLRIQEWHHVLAFTKKPRPTSLKEWRDSIEFTENDEQLERQIKNISGGLLELSASRATNGSQGKVLDNSSIVAGAGALYLKHGESRIVQVIHESVREFFLKNNGFSILDPSLKLNPIGLGHISIMSLCLDYLLITELDLSVYERNDHNPPKGENMDFKDLESQRRQPECERAAEDTGFEESGTQVAWESAIDICHWIDTSAIASSILPRRLGSVSCSETSMSVSGVSWVLQDSPTLLPYVLFSLFKHAHSAQESQATLESLFEHFALEENWSRWVTLKGDIPLDINFLEYATSCQSLERDDGAYNLEADAENNHLRFPHDSSRQYQNQLPPKKKGRSTAMASGNLGSLGHVSDRMPEAKYTSLPTSEQIFKFIAITGDYLQNQLISVVRSKRSIEEAPSGTDYQSQAPNISRVPGSAHLTSTKPLKFPSLRTSNSSHYMMEGGEGGDIIEHSDKKARMETGSDNRVDDDILGISKGDDTKREMESLQEVLKRMHSENMAARKKRRLQHDAVTAITSARMK